MFWVVLLGCQEIKGQTTIFSQNFESTTWTIPSTLSPAWTSEGTENNQWHMNSFTTGWTSNSGGYSPTGANGTNQSARFHTYDAPENSTGSLISPIIDFSAYSGQNKNLTFSMINTDDTDTVDLFISIDGGNSWGSTLGTYGNYSNWTVINVNLGTIASSNVKIKFVATSDYGLTDIGIDEVTIKTGYFFNSLGQNTWTAPACVTSVTVECWGAGGAGAGGNNNQAGAGGGGGAYAKSTISVNPGTVYIVNVGQGGAYNLYDIPGGNGSDTSFNYASSSISAKGGVGGGTGITVGVGGSATNSIGSTKFSGGNGGSGNSSNNRRAGGGGGSSAGTSSNGQNGGSSNNSINLGGIIIGGGNGGDGGNLNNGKQGIYGTIPGGGGGGGQNNYWAGGNGGDGQVVINWILPNVTTVSEASSSPTLCINSPLTNSTHTTTGATGIGTATGLPSVINATWANNTITISGTPTASGTFSYSIPLTGGCGNVNATGTIIVKPINTITLSSATGTNLQTVCMNTSITNITYTTSGATGIGTPTNLPTGITATWASNTITISGTPTVSGTFNYSIPLTGGCGNVNATGMITITPSVSYGSVSSLSSNTNTHLVISQVYGGGGNNNSVYKNDFIELFNPTVSSIDLNGWSVQYASTTGSTWNVTNLTGSIASGKYYLIQGFAGTGGTTNLPSPDLTSTLSINANAFKLALTNTQTALSGVIPTGTGIAIIDFFGCGTNTNGYETTLGPSPSNTASVFRINNGCTDTNDNNSDFISAIASPRNSSSPANICGGSTETICSGATPSAMSALGATGSTFTYQWYYQNGLVPAPTGTATTYWISLGTTAGANTATYTPTTGITSNTTYAVLVTPANCGTATWASGNRQVTVLQVTGGTIASNQTICSTKTPTAFTSTTYATSSGGTAINYQWESSTDNFATPGVAIASANSVTYSPGSLIATTYYRRKATSILNGVSCSAYSNILTITINPNPSTTLIYHQ